MLGNRVLEQDRIDDFSPRLKPGVSLVRTKQETPNALPTPLAPPFLPIAKARGISEDLDEFCRVFEVSKEHRDLFALACQDTAGGQDFLGEVGWSIPQWCRRSLGTLRAERGRGGGTRPDESAPLHITHLG